MKYLVSALVLLTSVCAFASQMMGNEALDMFRLMQHPQAQACLKDFPTEFVNLSIEKEVYRCAGCVKYTISANPLRIDMVSPEKSVVVINGSAVPGAVGRTWIQTYSCESK